MGDEEQSCAWTIHPGFEVNYEGSAIFHARRNSVGQQGDLALGIPNIRTGRFAVSFRFQPPAQDEGGGDVFLGVCDASAPVNESDAGKAWGVRVRTGDCHVTANAHFPGYRGRSLKPMDVSTPAPLRAGLLRAPLSATTCTVHIDMQQRTLHFALNGGPMVNSGVELPQAVRPWALTVGRRKGDLIRIADATSKTPPPADLTGLIDSSGLPLAHGGSPELSSAAGSALPHMRARPSPAPPPGGGPLLPPRHLRMGSTGRTSERHAVRSPRIEAYIRKQEKRIAARAQLLEAQTATGGMHAGSKRAAAMAETGGTQQQQQQQSEQQPRSSGADTDGAGENMTLPSLASQAAAFAARYGMPPPVGFPQPPPPRQTSSARGPRRPSAPHSALEGGVGGEAEGRRGSQSARRPASHASGRRGGGGSCRTPVVLPPNMAALTLLDAANPPTGRARGGGAQGGGTRRRWCRPGTRS